ncbi:TonB-dependent receptor [Sphingomonas sp. SM33]|uniref:TonB-dependent receptor n=1 Tax=Sphingomonas telluris TaxID=2907998 RepID=A0ABS9VIB4_9SPHN|nr:TonB-dependent receptor [Sphingomonas telluris]MCH8614714.1 TonB-dependent receptor [Sphingomonas telluris]
MPTAAYAQSTGTVEFEKEAVVVTGKRTKEVGGIQVPDAPKAKAVVTQEMISRSGPGQTVLDTINIVPGVSFQNNDAYGNAGGTLTMRGFDSTRVSYTLDGIQLNDSGNYNIYSNFSIDPELIEQVNVNLGSTDVDSPTASAVGGTINQRTRTPSEKMGGLMNLSLGQFDYRRGFAMFDTGVFTPWGTRAFVAASTSKYDNPFNNYGKLDRQQYNAKIWQPIGSNGDFVSIAGRYNQDRNNFFGSLPLRWDTAQANGQPRVVGPGSSNRFPHNNDEREYDINYPCQVDVPQAGIVDSTNTCGTEFDRRYNPSNSVNIRGNSKFSLTDQLTLTVDPSYQYTKANGGGTITGREGVRIIDGIEYTGFIGGQYYFGHDLNGDGDDIDTCSPVGSACSSFEGVTLLAPSQTRTRRYAVVAGLAYEINPDHLVRVTYTHDYSNHRQTGEVGFLKANGEPVDVFPVNDPIEDSNGNVVQKRDRQSYAILNKFAAEYRGQFGALRVNVGASLPYFKRDLENYCFTTSANGFVDCFGGDAQLEQAYAEEFPTVQGPQKRLLKYNKLLPSLGVVYDFSPTISAFASYTKNISVPSTDNLYNAFFFPADTASAKPNPETTDSFDAGVRYRSSKVQAQLAGWFTKFNDRLASAYDPELDRTVFRNLGRVDKWGIDGSVAYEPIRELTLYAFGSWQQSDIKDNIQIGTFGGITDCDNIPSTATDADILRSCALTAGNFESGSPKYTFGGSAVGRFSIFELGATVKRTGPRYVFDTNLPTFSGALGSPDVVEIFPAKAPAYTLVNLDARMKLTMLKGLENSYFQLNVYNLFDKFYVGGFGGSLNQAFSGTNYGNPAFVQIGAPRTISGTLSLAF